MPFRRAHHVTGSIVKLAEERGCGLADLPLDAMQAIEPGITEDIFSVLSVENAVASRVSDGGTAPEQVRQAVAAAQARFLLPPASPPSSRPPPSRRARPEERRVGEECVKQG